MTHKLFAFRSTVERMHEGPLGPHVDEFAESLRSRGYSVSMARHHILLMADLSRWLKQRGLSARHVENEILDQFLRHRRRRLLPQRADRPCLKKILDHFRAKGIVVLRPQRAVVTPIDKLAKAYGQYLEQERGLSRACLLNYLPIVRRFLRRRFGKGAISPARVRPDDVTSFVLRHAHTWSPGRAKLMVTALRSFFRFLRLRGEITGDLAGCVPTVPDWRLTTLPKSLRPEEVERLLKSCDRSTAQGRRDRAILLLLARLGLRAGEIVALELEDVDWAVGEIVVRGKGSHEHRLPLPCEVGKALADYLKHIRPTCATRRVFIRLRAPHVGFASSVAISTLVRRALERAGLNPPRTGAHLLRHTLASQMLRRGASLAEIGEILRHRNPDTTTIYAKVDVAKLRTLAQAWPGGRP